MSVYDIINAAGSLVTQIHFVLYSIALFAAINPILHLPATKPFTLEETLHEKDHPIQSPTPLPLLRAHTLHLSSCLNEYQ